MLTTAFSFSFSRFSGTTNLVFFAENKFTRIRETVLLTIGSLTPNRWVAGAGVHNMVEQGNSIAGVVDFAHFLNDMSERKELEQIIYLGTHYR